MSDTFDEIPYNGGNMYEVITIVLGLVGMFIIVGGIAYFLQNRAKKQGNLFTQPASPGTRIVAFISGLIFAVFFLLEILFEDRFHFVMPFLAILLFAYSLGFNRFIEAVQKQDK
jgi:drug/metabolite transporter (DMT)-like permease